MDQIQMKIMKIIDKIFSKRQPEMAYVRNGAK
jgi:hypothetical protein